MVNPIFVESERTALGVSAGTENGKRRKVNGKRNKLKEKVTCSVLRSPGEQRKDESTVNPTFAESERTALGDSARTEKSPRCITTA
jgi:hypothetical protein